MKIEYAKQIKDFDTLKQFITDSFGNNSWRKLNSEGLEKELMDALQKGLFAKGMDVTRTSHNNLWVASPERFSLTLEDSTCYYHDAFASYSHVDISGQVLYEKLAGPDPKEVLNVLNAQGYGALVIPAAPQIIAAIEKAREPRVREVHHTRTVTREPDGILSSLLDDIGL